ncbi:MAG TPA: hypothetical protein DIW31_03335 [Bacteroidales bacterium]|nr:hypothetical protein [Bacteroidales bacterium]
MKELEKNELMQVEGGSILEKLTGVGIAFWVMDNWADVKKGIYDGWTECHSSTEVDAISYAG